MAEPMKVLTLHQPYASLIALGIKTFETRSQPFASLVGKRIAIHAAATWKTWERLDAPYLMSERTVIQSIFQALGVMEPDGRSWPSPYVTADAIHVGDVVLPLGAIVCTAVVTASLPIRNVHGGATDNFIWYDGTHLHVERGGRCSNSTLVTDQLPYGDYRPGRWALPLADVDRLAIPLPFKGGQGL